MCFCFFFHQELESKQGEIASENKELKELCMFLDEERKDIEKREEEYKKNPLICCHCGAAITEVGLPDS